MILSDTSRPVAFVDGVISRVNFTVIPYQKVYNN